MIFYKEKSEGNGGYQHFDEEDFVIAIEKNDWKSVSKWHCWTETQIDKYQDKLDWKLLSENYNYKMKWSSSLLEKYEHKLDWDRLSENDNGHLFTIKKLHKFSDKWNWEILSSNRSAFQQVEQVEEFKDKIVWSELIERGTYYEDYFTFDFVKKYKSYIPADKFFKSALWKWILQDNEQEMFEKILRD